MGNKKYKSSGPWGPMKTKVGLDYVCYTLPTLILPLTNTPEELLSLD
jgi:hypothetical protein